MEDLVASWFAKDNIDSFLMPTYLQTPTASKNSSANQATQSSPTELVGSMGHNATIDSLVSLSAFTSYPSINIPIGYSQKGMPIGMLLLSKPETLVKSLNAAKLLENQYADIRLPRTAPELNKTAFLSSARFYYLNVFTIIILLFL